MTALSQPIPHWVDTTGSPEYRCTMRLFAAVLVCLATMISSAASIAADVVSLVLGTATPGGGFSVYGKAVADTLLETDPTLEITLHATGGSTENIPLLEAGKLDLALVEGTTAYEALTGVGRTPTALKVVAAMYPSPGMFVVRGDSSYRTIHDLKSQRVVFGVKTSGLVVMARHVLDGLSLDLVRDFDAVLLERAADGPPMVLSGEAAALWGAGTGWPGFTSVARGPNGARFIGLEPNDIAAIQAKHPFLKTMTVPPGSYLGQDRAITTVGAWSVILARPDLPDTAAYRFARALHLGQPALGQRLAQAQDTTPENTLAAAPRPDMLHPGVARYLREIGLM
jgi:TRAP transporter TAXI family solute receptor